MSLSLEKYTGTWDKYRARHLLSRTLFGYSKELLQESIEMGLDESLSQLLSDIDLPYPPTYNTFDADPTVAEGETWVYTRATAGIDMLVNSRRQSLRVWQTRLLYETTFNIREKMVLFWHEHFAIAGLGNPRVEFQYLDTLRRNALGNFRILLEEITISPAMLLFLNGNENTREAPNENYSRELLELFAIGRGPVAGEGDYTHYTEQDVFELAKALTGWVISVTDSGLPGGTYRPARHDESVKQLSARLDKAFISNAGENEYKIVIDTLLKQKQAAIHLCRQLHIWFVSAEITEEIENSILVPLAEMLIDDNYDIKNTLITLLSSQYFNDFGSNGCIISSPIDYMYKLLKSTDFELPADDRSRYNIFLRLFNVASEMEMRILDLPSVAGWKAYYQAPQFSGIWINTGSLNLRQDLVNSLITGFEYRSRRYQLDLNRYVSALENQYDPNLMIQEITDNLFVVSITAEQIASLKELLIPGLPDFEWTVEYADFVANPNDQSLAISITNKLQNLFSAILKMPEFYLS